MGSPSGSPPPSKQAIDPLDELDAVIEKIDASLLVIHQCCARKNVKMSTPRRLPMAKTVKDRTGLSPILKESGIDIQVAKINGLREDLVADDG